MSAQTTKKHILVVEDEDQLRDLYVRVLNDEGYEVDQAKDGQEAYDKMSQNTYNLVLLDVIMAKLDGMQVLESLQKAEKLKQSPVVLLSSLGQDLVIAKALEYGVRGYMVKSDYTPQELVKEVKGYVEDGEVRSALQA
ncbi:MAG: response regulator [Weeksellaceae bacterium]